MTQLVAVAGRGARSPSRRTTAGCCSSTSSPARCTELAANDDGEIDDVSWSPDSAWLAWAQPGPRPLARIRLARVEDGFTVDVTDGRFVDSDPVFTVDGLYLAFLSRRTFDPIYDAHSFDLSFPFGVRPTWCRWPRTRCRRSARCPAAARSAAGEVQRTRRTRLRLTVDTDGISSRVVAVPVDEARYYSLAAVKGGLLWLPLPACPACSARAPRTRRTGTAGPRSSGSTCASARRACSRTR